MTDGDFSIDLQTVRTGYDRQTCWVQTRAAMTPANLAVMTTQKLRLTGSDIFYDIHLLRSSDGGRTWGEPERQQTLGRRRRDDGVETCPCDGTPKWHAASERLLLTGHLALYEGDHLYRGPYERRTWYSVLAPDASQFGPCQILEMPDRDTFFDAGAGCAQRVDLANGDVLLPVYFRTRRQHEVDDRRCQATVVRCSFDGETMRYLEHGTELRCDVPRGFCEPSLVSCGGRCFITLRNDECGWVAASDDGLDFTAPRPWTFDDGQPLGNYNTQQHWLTHGDQLFLVYTRRGADNDHVFRHRAPLFVARVDPAQLCVIRASERPVVPERGARLGNFGVCEVSAAESWVVVSEWMQTTAPDPHDCTVCERYGSDNAIFISRLQWDPRA